MADSSNYTAIVTALGTWLTDAGAPNVHPRQRHVAFWSKLMTLFKGDEDIVHGWTISRSAVAEEWETNKEVERHHTFKIRGIYGASDANDSETAFQEFIETVSDKWREDFDLDGTAEQRSPLQFPVIDYRLFGGILCHYAEGTVTVTELLASGG